MMVWKRLAVVLAGIAIGISVPIGLTEISVASRPVTARADSVEHSGTIGTCSWKLSADGKTLTIDGGNGGTLPEGDSVDTFSGYGVVDQVIEKQLKNVMPNEPIPLRNLEDINLVGHLKTGKNATYLFAGLRSHNDSTQNLNGLSNLNTDDATDMEGMFSNTNFSSLDLSKFNTDNVTNMSRMFSDDRNLHNLDLSSFNTSKVTDMSRMFAGLAGLDQQNSLVLGNHFDTHNVTSMRQMFLAVALPTLDLSKLDTANVTDMSSMFGQMDNLTKLDVSPMDTSKVTLMDNMFVNTSNLENIKFGGKFNTSNVQDMSSMFYGTKKLDDVDFSHIDTSKVTSMYAMFANAPGFVKLDLTHFDTSKVTDMSFMFNRTSNLKNVNVSSFQTKNVKDFNQMFQSCESLIRLDLSNFDTRSAMTKIGSTEDVTQGFSLMFNDDPSLTSLDISNFSMTYDKAGGLYTYTGNMFSGDNQLSRLVLGPSVRFIKDEDLSLSSEGPALADVPLNETYTGKWEAVGTGTETNPRGQTYSTSDDLVNAYMGDKRPTGRQTYVWEPVKRPVTPPVFPVTPPNVDEPATEGDGEVFTGSSVDAVKKIGLYRQPTFTKKNRITWYAKQPQTRQPQFVVTGKATSKNGVARYQVRDVNHHSKTYRLTGYVTTRAAYVVPTYMSKSSRDKVITVINPRGINGYGHANLTQKQKHYRQGQQLKVKRLVTHNLTTRFQLENGQYVTANRQWVQNGRKNYPRKITTTYTIWRYRDVNFKQAVHHYRRHQQLVVTGWDYSDQGTLRYRVAGGYVTANARFVK